MYILMKIYHGNCHSMVIAIWRTMVYHSIGHVALYNFSKILYTVKYAGQALYPFVPLIQTWHLMGCCTDEYDLSLGKTKYILYLLNIGIVCGHGHTIILSYPKCFYLPVEL